MRPRLTILALLVTLPVLLAAGRCNNCDEARALAVAACAQAPESQACKDARAAADQACAPAPPPTTTTTTTTQPGPGDCSAKPVAAEGHECPDTDPTTWCGCWSCSGRSGGEWHEMPACPAPPAACVLSGEPARPIPGHVQALGAIVNEAIRAVTGEAGGRIVVAESRQAFQARVVSELRRRGLCAGQHGPGTDEIAVATSATAPWEGYHIYAGADAGPGTAVLSPQADRGAWYAPGTEPAPPPSQPATCGAPLPPGVGRIQLDVRAYPNRTVVDATLVVRDCAYCAEIGMGEMGGVPRCGCPVRPEGHPQRVACEALYPISWRGPGHATDNPALWELPAGVVGTVTACGGGVCESVEVTP